MPRLLIVFVSAIVLAVPAFAVAPPAPTRASNDCTGWTSRIDPPPTIRVGRRDGSVDIVDFYTYVGRVMAKEWGAARPAAALEAAAVAVKQYGWYYTLAGNWRKSYLNVDGECFDVKDTTADQIYRHDVTVGASIWRAVDATWGLTVRKSGKFFLTGYRSGKTSECGADANGWKLFARSVFGCAHDGLSREQIQLIYYAPDVTFHWSTVSSEFASVDTPISAPRASILASRRLPQVHSLISWDSASSRPAGTTYQLQRLVSGSWREVALADATRSSVELYVKPNRVHRFRVRLRDEKGNVGLWYPGPKFKARRIQDTNVKGGFWAWSKGAWSTQKTSNAAGGYVTYATATGSTAEFTFTGRAVGLVSTRGPKMGVARIYVDGALEAEIDLYAASNRWRVIVFSRDWAAAATRTVRVEVVGTKGRPRVNVDAMLFYP